MMTTMMMICRPTF